MNKNSYQTIIYECSKYSDLSLEISSFYSSLNNSGNFFLIADNEVNESHITNSIFDYIELATSNNFFCKNIIIFPQILEPVKFKKNIRYIVWFVKDLSNSFFDKDKIREKHIWKDVEWGKRAKNYNPLGKDPGNVWIPTEDDGKGNITKHILLSLEAVINRCIDSTTTNSEDIYIKHFSSLNFDEINSSNVTFQSYQEPSQSHNQEILETYKNIYENVKADVIFDTSESMNEVEDNSLDLMVTSPPYWDLKNYFKPGQIGQESYEEYLIRLSKVWAETYRCLKETGHMWININVRTKNRKLVNIPLDIINSCKKIGFALKDIIIWHKSSGIPTNKNNLTDRHEYFLWFVKSDKNVVFLDGVESISDYENFDINHGLIWNINRKAGSVGKDYIHPAIYPNELINRVINLCSDKGGLILDPFLGSGTTMLSALSNNRNFIGYEYNENFDKLIIHRSENELNKTDNISFHYKHSSCDSNTPNQVLRK